MTLIRPSFVENLFNSFFSLEPDRPMYYRLVIRLAKSIFQSMGQYDKIEEMNKIVKGYIEIPLEADFISVLHAFYSPRFMFSKNAYCRVGDSIKYKEITRFEIEQRLEKVKDWVYDEVTTLSYNVRFTQQQPLMH